MYELTYESVATDNLSSAEIEQILETSRANNAEKNVTGCLVYYNDRFIQILEGKKAAVQEIYEKIKQDKRHKQVRLIAENVAPELTFPHWGMAYFPIDDTNINENELEQFRRNLKLLADFSNPASVTTILFWKKVKFLVAERPD